MGLIQFHPTVPKGLSPGTNHSLSLMDQMRCWSFLAPELKLKSEFLLGLKSACLQTGTPRTVPLVLRSPLRSDRNNINGSQESASHQLTTQILGFILGYLSTRANIFYICTHIHKCNLHILYIHSIRFFLKNSDTNNPH